MKKRIAALLLAMTMTAAFAGCGSDGDAASGSAENKTETSDTEEKADFLVDTEEEIDRSKETTGADSDGADVSDAIADGVLTVGTNAEFPPFEYIGDDGEPDGFDIALIKAIGEKLDVEVEVENMEFASLVGSIGSKIDVSIAGMTVTDERKASVDFSDSYYEAVQYVIVPADSTIAGVEDLEGKTIGVQLGTTGDIIAGEIADASVSQYNKAVDAVNDLLNGRVDTVIIDRNPAMVFSEKFGEDIKIIDGADFDFEPEDYAIAMPKGDTALLNSVNQALAEVKEDGTFDKLVSQYIEENE